MQTGRGDTGGARKTVGRGVERGWGGRGEGAREARRTRAAQAPRSRLLKPGPSSLLNALALSATSSGERCLSRTASGESLDVTVWSYSSR